MNTHEANGAAGLLAQVKEVSEPDEVDWVLEIAWSPERDTLSGIWLHVLHPVGDSCLRSDARMCRLSKAHEVLVACSHTLLGVASPGSVVDVLGAVHLRDVAHAHVWSEVRWKSRVPVAEPRDFGVGEGCGHGVGVISADDDASLRTLCGVGGRNSGRSNGRSCCGSGDGCCCSFDA